MALAHMPLPERVQCTNRDKFLLLQMDFGALYLKPVRRSHLH